MFSNVASNNSNRAVSICCVLTLVYVPPILLFLYATEYIYLINRYYCIVLICGLLIVEFLKYVICFLFIDNYLGSKDTKLLKSKKTYKMKVKELFKCGFIIFDSVLILYIMAILFGAPLLSEYEETLTFAILVSALTVFPSCLHLGADNTLALLIGAKLNLNRVGDMLLKNILLTILGAWLGAIVIPLDWDRPWQVWPLPCCTGAVIGYILSHFIVLLKGMPNVLKLVNRIVF